MHIIRYQEVNPSSGQVSPSCQTGYLFRSSDYGSLPVYHRNSKQILQKSNRELRTPSLLLVLQNNEIDVGALSFGLVDWNESAQLCKVIINIGLKTIIQIASYCYVVVVITRSLSTVALRQNFDLISPIFCLFLLDHKPPRLSCFKSQLPIRPDNV